MYLGEYAIDDYVDLVATAHQFSSGAAYAPTSITYTVYEDGSTTAMISATAMTNFNSVTGFYFDRIQLTSALGFENGKSYVVLIQATVDSVAAIDWRSFRVRAAAPANITQIGGSSVDTTSAQLGVNVINWKSSTAPEMTGDAYALTSNATYGLSALKTILDTISGYIDTEVAAIKAKTDNLPSSPAEVGSQMALTSAAVQAIWDALTSALTTSGSVGKLLADNIDTAVSSRSTFAGGAVASVTAAVTVGTNNDKTGYSLSTTPPTAAEIKTALEAAGGDLALIMAQTDKIGDGTVGLSNLKTLIDTIDTVVDAVKAKTDNLPTDPASESIVSSRAPASTALSSEVWTAAKAAMIDAAISSVSGGSLTESGIADAVLDEACEGTITLRQAVMVFLAVLAGTVSGGGGTTIAFKDPTGSTTRVTATVDENGNRTGITLNVTS